MGTAYSTVQFEWKPRCMWWLPWLDCATCSVCSGMHAGHSAASAGPGPVLHMALRGTAFSTGPGLAGAGDTCGTISELLDVECGAVQVGQPPHAVVLDQTDWTSH